MLKLGVMEVNMTKKLAVIACLLGMLLPACVKNPVPSANISELSKPPSTAPVEPETSNEGVTEPTNNTDSSPNNPAPNPNPPSPSNPAPPPKPPVPSPPPAVVVPPNLDTARYGWGYTVNSTHTTPVIPSKINNWLKQYNGYYVGNTSTKVVYLTFDEGYENGYTPAILDTLKKHNVHACFFVTQSYITKNPALIMRMVNEGHIVANHTVTHRSLNELSEQEIQAELNGVENSFKTVTGGTLPKYLRPPQGDFSEKSLWTTNKLGYKTVWWSIAYRDWDTANQPTTEQALSLIKNNIHNGAVILLHAVSKTNSDALEQMLQIIASGGYQFGQITQF